MPWQRSGRFSRAGRSRGGSRGPSRRRPKEWECALLATPLALPIGICDQSFLITRAELDDEYSDSTVVRIRGEFAARIDAVGVGSTSTGAAGIIEVEGVHDDDVIAYCPGTDCDASWIWHQYFTLFNGVGADPTQGPLTARSFEIDSAAMRRLEAGDSSLWIAVENTGLTTFTYNWHLRMLLAEK